MTPTENRDKSRNWRKANPERNLQIARKAMRVSYYKNKAARHAAKREFYRLNPGKDRRAK